MEKGIAVVDGVVILNKMKSNALQTVVDVSHSFNEPLLSMTREYDDIMLLFDTSSCVCHHAPLICPEHCSRAMIASHRPEQ